jgi:pilus assembly protein FimV
MSNGKNPLMLMMALTMPGASHALGLGDIHVDSALNERLAAEIDIVGASAVELNDLRAAVANNETFLRYGADRPAFLSSTTFKVVQDSQGRPVLAVRSTESFTEPLVNLLVDLHWRNNEMVREYTLLLDPAGFASAPPAPAAPNVPAAPPAATPVVETKTQTVARQMDPPADQSDPGAERAVRKTTHIKVGARATLRGIAWRVGERSDSDLQRMMIAIFRANPTAFDGNINRLHLGAVLTIPSHAEAAAISKAEARHEVHAQMAAWRTPGRAVAASGGRSAVPVAATPVAATPVAATTSVAATSVAAIPVRAASVAGAQPATPMPGNGAEGSPAAPADQELDHRVQSMEQELSDMKGQLERERDQLMSLQEQTARAEKTAPAVAPAAAEAPPAHSKAGYSMSIPAAAGVGVLIAALAGLYFKFRRRAWAVRDPRSSANSAAADATAGVDVVDAAVSAAPNAAQKVAPEPVPETAATRALGSSADAPDDALTDVQPILETDADDSTHPLLPIIAAGRPVGRSEVAGAASSTAGYDPTVNLRVDAVNLRVDQTRLDYNLVDLDMTAQHVHMPSVLNENAVVKERRTNLADVLKMAIEREPDRHDLRMKLLELYYSAAATNRQAFLETVQKFARDRDYLQPDQWDKIARMGRQIASENPMFTEASADDDLANCA